MAEATTTTPPNANDNDNTTAAALHTTTLGRTAIAAARQKPTNMSNREPANDGSNDEDNHRRRSNASRLNSAPATPPLPCLDLNKPPPSQHHNHRWLLQTRTSYHCHMAASATSSSKPQQAAIGTAQQPSPTRPSPNMLPPSQHRYECANRQRGLPLQWRQRQKYRRHGLTGAFAPCALFLPSSPEPGGVDDEPMQAMIQRICAPSQQYYSQGGAMLNSEPRQVLV